MAIRSHPRFTRAQKRLRTEGKRLQEIEKLIEQDKQLVLTTIDALLRDAKARKAYSK